jgi:protein-S-isoprenylcysteine O-methyltransferase Ste14
MKDTMNDHPNINKNIHPPVVALISMSLAIVMEWIVPIAFPSYWKIVGLALVAVGLLLAFSAVNEFRKAQTTLDPHGSPKALVSNGIYRFTRNPIYLGFFLIIIGFPLYFESVWGVIAAPLFAMTLRRLVIEKEEAYLEKKFGEAYTGYKSRVRRWL